MSSFQDPDLQERQSAAAAAKKAMLEKFRAASEDPVVAQRHAARVAVNEARLARIAEREAAKRVREAELAEQAARAAELALQAQREAEKAEALAAAEKAERALLKSCPGCPIRSPQGGKKRTTQRLLTLLPASLVLGREAAGDSTLRRLAPRRYRCPWQVPGIPRCGCLPRPTWMRPPSGSRGLPCAHR